MNSTKLSCPSGHLKFGTSVPCPCDSDMQCATAEEDWKGVNSFVNTTCFGRKMCKFNETAFANLILNTTCYILIENARCVNGAYTIDISIEHHRRVL